MLPPMFHPTWHICPLDLGVERRRPSANAFHDGMSKPSTPLSWCAARAAERVDGPASSTVLRKPTVLAAIVGCHSWRDCQLDQLAEGGFLKTRPHKKSGMPAISWGLGTIDVDAEEPAQARPPNIMAFCLTRATTHPGSPSMLPPRHRRSTL